MRSVARRLDVHNLIRLTRSWLLIVCVFAAYANEQTAGHYTSEEAIPLRRGSVWTYHGTLTVRKKPDHPAFRTDPVQLKMRIREVIRRPGTSPARQGVAAALVDGFPYDLFPVAATTGLGRYLLIETGHRLYLIEEPARVDAVIKRFRDAADLLTGVVRETELLLAGPLAVGQRLCESDQITRTDGAYCWNVLRKSRLASTGIKGAPIGLWTEFVMEFGTLSGSKTFHIAPGIGITRFAFESTCASCGEHGDIRLVEYHAGME